MGGGFAGQLVQCLPWKHRDLGSNPQKPYEKAGLAVNI